MVNLLETLYGLTTIAFIAAIILHFRGQRIAARRLGFLGALGALLAFAMYWYLGRSA